MDACQAKIERIDVNARLLAIDDCKEKILPVLYGMNEACAEAVANILDTQFARYMGERDVLTRIIGEAV